MDRVDSCFKVNGYNPGFFFFKKMYFQASEFNVGKEPKGCWNHRSPQSIAGRKEATKERGVVTGRRAFAGTKVGA